MMRLINDFEEVEFEDLEEAKNYYLPSEELDKDIRNKEKYLGNNFGGYIKSWEEYILGIKTASSLDKLAEVLNNYSDEFNNGSRWKIINL